MYKLYNTVNAISGQSLQVFDFQAHSKKTPNQYM